MLILPEEALKQTNSVEHCKKDVRNDSLRLLYNNHLLDNVLALEKDVLWLLVILILRASLTWSNLSTQVFLRFLSTSLEKTTILYLDNTSTLDLYLDHKHS